MPGTISPVSVKFQFSPSREGGHARRFGRAIFAYFNSRPRVRAVCASTMPFTS